MSTKKALVSTFFASTLFLLLIHRHVSSYSAFRAGGHVTRLVDEGGSGSSSSLVHQTCKNSSIGDPNIPYSFCVAALQSAPASMCAALPRLGLLSLRLLEDNVTDTRCRVKLLIKDTSSSTALTDAVTKAALGDCLELYSNAVDTLKEAVGDYKEGGYYEANVKVSAVMEAAVTCEEGFRDGGVRSPLTRWNGFAFRLSAISLSIMNLLRSARLV